MDQKRLTHLRQLEAESIHIIREVAAEFSNPVMLYSIGKDSSVMLHLARKAFYPGTLPFPLLELAERLKNTPTEYGIRFVATSGEEEGKLGAENLLKRMSDTEKKNTLLVINLDNLIVGDKLYFNSGVKTPEAVRKLTRDRALAIARSHGIAATTNPGLNKNYPKGTGCCNDAEVFDKAGIAVLSVEATNWNLGNKDGYQQRAKTAAFPAGNSWHDVRLDNQQHIDKALPGRIERRCRDVMRIMLPLVKELAKAS